MKHEIGEVTQHGEITDEQWALHNAQIKLYREPTGRTKELQDYAEANARIWEIENRTVLPPPAQAGVVDTPDIAAHTGVRVIPVDTTQ